MVARARRGDVQAFEELYRTFARPVHALAWRLLQDADEAADVLHDVMLKVHHGLPGFRGEAPIWAWIRQIASNEALMRLRRRSRLEYLPGDELPEPEDDGTHWPLQAAEQALLGEALAQLPAVTRAVIWLYHGEGLTHEEIGSAMGRSRSFSKSQLMRGVNRLRQMLRIDKEEPSHA
nr:sigma-70 family RNA polymerase sigma factor [Lysobacter sp. CAU 1642]